MARGAVVLAFGLAIGGCSAVDVSPELKLMAEATRATSSATLALANSDPESERQRRLDRAAASRQPWVFAGNCQPVPQVEQRGEACRLDRRGAWDSPLPEDALRRKISGINAYVAALSEIASAQNDAMLGAAYASAIGALGGLADASESEALQRTIARLKEDQAAVGELSAFLVANRRAQILKRTVLRNRAAFSTVLNEVIDLAAPLSGEADRLKALQAEMFSLRTQALLVRNDPAAYRDALDRLDRAHAAFVAAKATSLVGQIAALGAAHEALAQRLRRPASLAEIETFTKALAKLRVAF
jgi:hypothetical protein